MKVSMLKPITFVFVSCVIAIEGVFLYVLVQFAFMLMETFNALLFFIVLVLAFFIAILFYTYIYQLRKEIFGLMRNGQN